MLSTTNEPPLLRLLLLFIRISKIQFVCYPQQRQHETCKNYGCLSGFQRYNLCAIHNFSERAHDTERVVYQDFKDTICVLSTTQKTTVNPLLPLFIRISKIQFVCYPQPNNSVDVGMAGCLSGFQRYNLCAIHNSNSLLFVSFLVVYQDFKDTICVLSTTGSLRSLRSLRLFIRISKIQFVCYPQPDR